MLGSSSRLPVHPVTTAPDWEEATFTRPMRSPFAVEPPADVDVDLEEAALFEATPVRREVRPRKLPTATPSPALRRVATRRSVPPPPMDAETTTRASVEPELLRALRECRDSSRLMQAALDLNKTVEEPSLALLERSAVHSRK